MDDPVDSVGPWTIKSVAVKTREAVTNAARKEGLTVGQWLERRVREWEGQGSPVPVEAALAPSPAPQVDLGDLAALLTATMALSEKIGVDLQPALLRDATATLRQAMRRPKRQPAAIAPPAQPRIEG